MTGYLLWDWCIFTEILKWTCTKQWKCSHLPRHEGQIFDNFKIFLSISHQNCAWFYVIWNPEMAPDRTFLHLVKNNYGVSAHYQASSTPLNIIIDMPKRQWFENALMSLWVFLHISCFPPFILKMKVRFDMRDYTNLFTNTVAIPDHNRLVVKKVFPTIWGTYMKAVTKYQISAINSCWEKCDDNILDGRKDRRQDGQTDRGKTEYPPPRERGYKNHTKLLLYTTRFL
jgi:hypothetical protein